MENDITDIQSARLKNGCTQEQAATAIGVSRPTYASIESGDREITISQAVRLARLFRVDVGKLIGKELGVSLFTDALDDEKYRQIIMNSIHYGADSDGRITKTKLAKLAYLIDFIWFYEHSESMSDMSYRKYPRGPVSDVYFRILDDLEEDGAIVREPRGRAIMYSMVEPHASSSNLTDEELATIQRICHAWRDKSTEDIVNFTHDQFPWQICRDGEIIPYSLIFQEEPDKIYGPVQV